MGKASVFVPITERSKASGAHKFNNTVNLYAMENIWLSTSIIFRDIEALRRFCNYETI
jgi:hypothetical protein